MKACKVFYIFALAVLLVPMIVTTAPVAAQEEVTLSMWVSPDNADALSYIAEKFMADNPNIKIAIETISWETLYAKTLADVAAGTGAFDIATWDVMTAGAMSKAFIDLAAFKEEHPDLVDPEWDPDDFDPVIWHIAGMWEDRNIGIPFYNNTMLFYYRKDYFEDEDLKAAFEGKYGRELTVPKTWAEGVEVGEFFTKEFNSDSPTDYGIALMFPRTHTTFYMYLLWFAPYRRSEEGIEKFGELDLDYGDFFTGDRKPAFASEEGVRALEDIMALMPYSPDPLGSDYGETLEYFTRGTVVMVPTWTGVWATFREAEVLQPMEEKVGVAVMPSGHSCSGNWALGINRVSKHQEEAFMFVQYATNKENDKEKFLNFGVAPSRVSTLEDPEVQAADPRVPILYETYPDEAHRPRIPEEPKLEEVTIGTFTEILGGERPNTVETLQELADQWMEILEE